MERIIAGKITLFREQCPNCGEYNLSGNKTFVCTTCNGKYGKQDIENTRILAKSRRKQMPREIRRQLFIIQQNKCYWCGREFEIWYKTRKGKIPKQLEAVGDHQIPYSYCQTNPDDNWCLSCNICNGMKSDKLFKDTMECRKFLKNRWVEKLEKSEIIVL